MISVDGAENPWKTIYPFIALHDTSAANTSLYHALLAQSAFHLSNLHLPKSAESRRNRQRGLEHYVESLIQLQESLKSTITDFDAPIATLMTLTMVEGVYAAESQQWRCHIEGAVSVLAETMKRIPRLVSTNAWILAQSLVLLFELAQTSRPHMDRLSNAMDGLREFVSSKPIFGYTVGASRDVLCSIAGIHAVRTKMEDGLKRNDAIESVTPLLESLQSEESDSDLPQFLLEHHHGPGTTTDSRILPMKSVRQLEMLHRRIFRNATIIYLHRTIFNSHPLMLEDYVDRVLDDTIAFLDHHGGSVAPWPVFMAAIDAYKGSAQTKVSRWLEYSCALGIHNRYAFKQIIEDVWAERENRASLSKIEPHQIIVDWKQIQKKLGIDVLLL
ncbi:uncharacterized protein A1O9_02318 [Exophiala aquamarina CBS 119918]|uniref:Uncharacterized protein n=1 Tax=Exophiala aquamarina CBS 119918 TaxID=1182545 RepID=A0A072PM18_9EURO|nr:uncharacterized protein A1O9_02318 [Exophiala aquamarina CBS 119918]KEF60757.1 hypothetical protein A1O9_02318 [Exophiala aquamarina CBS 119918]